MAASLPTKVLAVGLITGCLLFCGSCTSPMMPVPSKADIAGRSDIQANVTPDAAAYQPHQIALVDRFGYRFHLSLLNQSEGHDIYEGYALDPVGNRFPAAGIYHRRSGALTLSSYVQKGVPYYCHLEPKADGTFSGYEQYLDFPWEHYGNIYRIVEGGMR